MTPTSTVFKSCDWDYNPKYGASVVWVWLTIITTLVTQSQWIFAMVVGSLAL